MGMSVIYEKPGFNVRQNSVVSLMRAENSEKMQKKGTFSDSSLYHCALLAGGVAASVTTMRTKWRG